MMRNHKIVSKCNIFAWLCGRKDAPSLFCFSSFSPLITPPYNLCPRFLCSSFEVLTFHIFLVGSVFCFPLFIIYFFAVFVHPDKITLFG